MPFARSNAAVQGAKRLQVWFQRGVGQCGNGGIDVVNKLAQVVTIQIKLHGNGRDPTLVIHQQDASAKLQVGTWGRKGSWIPCFSICFPLRADKIFELVNHGKGHKLTQIHGKQKNHKPAVRRIIDEVQKDWQGKDNHFSQLRSLVFWEKNDLL